MSKTGVVLAVVVVAVLALVAWEWRYSPFFSRLLGTAPQGQLVAQAHYQCDGDKAIDADFFAGQSVPVQAGQPPVPTGKAVVKLSDGRTLTLPQTLSADGTRYSDGDPQKRQGQSGAETFVFWSKGSGALVLENNEEKSYTGCVQVVDDPGTLPQVYASGGNGFSIRYPSGYAVDEQYTYLLSGSTATPARIRGVQFTIDSALASGTNLSADSYLSVEQLASTHSTSSGQAGNCSATKFLSDPSAATVWNDGTNQYSYASSTGAAAGNRYEEQIFALPGTNPCVAVRYFVHYGVLENYPQNAVQGFNRDALNRQFDAIRQTLTVVQ